MKMMLDSKALKKSCLFILFSLSFALILSYVHPTFSIDEEYTMGIIQHSYSNIISINSLDVHPPTYYLLLKFFLGITTFWTQSMFIKIIFGRMFSAIAFVMAFYFLHKITNLLGYYVIYVKQLLLYLILFPVSMYAVTMRMHGFSSLFNILEYYMLIKFCNDYNKKHLIMILIWGLFAAYIDYFSAVCAGMFIFICFIRYFIKNNTYIYIHLLFIGFIYLLFSIPLIILGINQISYRSKFSTNSTLLNNIKLLLESFTQFGGTSTIMIMIPLLIIIIWTFLHMNKSFIVVLNTVLLNYFLTNIIAIFTCMKIGVYESRLLYPQFSIYSFLLITSLIISLHKDNLIHKISICMICLLCIISVMNIHRNVVRYVVPSIELCRNINNIKQQQASVVHLNYYRIPAYWPESEGLPKQIYLAQESIYLNDLHKKVVVRNDTIKKASGIVNGKTILFKNVFNNLSIK